LQQLRHRCQGQPRPPVRLAVQGRRYPGAGGGRQVHDQRRPAGLREDAGHGRLAGRPGACRRALSAGSNRMDTPPVTDMQSAEPGGTMLEAGAPPTRMLRVLSANIQAGSSTRRYSDYVTRSWSHALPAGRKRTSLDAIAQLAAGHDIVGLQEADPG